jgi:ribosomal protein L31
MHILLSYIFCFVFYQETSGSEDTADQAMVTQMSSKDDQEIVMIDCSLCHAKFLDKQSLKVHGREHRSNISFECKTCKKKFKELSSLNLHHYLTEGCNTSFEHL